MITMIAFTTGTGTRSTTVQRQSRTNAPFNSRRLMKGTAHRSLLEKKERLKSSEVKMNDHRERLITMKKRNKHSSTSSSASLSSSLSYVSLLKCNSNNYNNKRTKLLRCKSALTETTIQQSYEYRDDEDTKSDLTFTDDDRSFQGGGQRAKNLPATTTTIKWWEKYTTKNLITVKNADELIAYLYASATLITRDIDNMRKINDNDNESSKELLAQKSPLVVVKYFREDCPACSRLNPKFTKIAEKEFSNVLFLKVNLSEFNEDFAEKMNVPSVPYVQVFNGSEGLVNEFAINLMPQNLNLFRSIVSAYANCVDNLPKTTPEQQGPVSVIKTNGWPGFYSGQMRKFAHVKRTFWRFRRGE